MNIKKNLFLALLIFSILVFILPATAELNSKLENQNYLHSASYITLLEQGQQLYAAGKLTEAAKIWEQATQIFKQNKEQRNLILSYNYLAIVYQDLGKWEAASSAINQAQNILETFNDSLLEAQVLNTQGSLQLNRGKPENALKTWQQAEKIYRSLGDITGITLSQINQATAWQSLGQYRRAKTELEKINQDLVSLPDSIIKARGLRSLGITLQVVGDFQGSQEVLSASLAIAQRLSSTTDVGDTLLSLGNTARAKEDFATALKFYQQAANLVNNPHIQLEAKLNEFSLLVKNKQYVETLDIASVISEVQGLIANVTPSRWGVYAQVNFAESLMNLSPQKRTNDITKLLVTAVKQGRELNDIRAESYALGQLAHLYEQNQQYSESLILTQQALSLTQAIDADDIAVNWLWQQGRIKKIMADIQGAITAYEQAVKILESLRQDLLLMNPNIQFSFRDKVEPIYRQLVQLLLQNVDGLPEISKQQRLEKSRQTIEALQLRELENFFREACLTYQPQPIDKIDSTAAVIYPILLERRLEVIVSLPGKLLQHFGRNISLEEESKVFAELRQSLNPAFLLTEVLPPAQKLYDWLVRPIEEEIEGQKIKTLVFVLDGFLRSVPMSVLHDGKQYLMQKYNLALTPSLQLLESSKISPQNFQVLSAGLAAARQGFSDLPGVKQEIRQISNLLPTKILFNETFTHDNLQKQIEKLPFSAIHLATHGQFSSKAEDTFLLTWDDKINVKDFDRWLKGSSSKLRDRQPIELLVLSACQTAKGDNRAVLGLAGIAMRSGARSTLATLWSVQDKSTADLVTEFYRLLTQKGISKAAALRQAQMSLLNSSEYKHPYYWSPFVLVGNWR